MAFHQCLHYIAKTKSVSRERNTILLEISTCDPIIYTMNLLDLTVSTLWKIPLVLKGLNVVELDIYLMDDIHLPPYVLRSVVKGLMYTIVIKLSIFHLKTLHRF